MTRSQLDTLCLAMTAHDAGDPKRIQHFMKVSAFAALIARGEGLTEEQVALLTAVGYVHDIGIRVAEERLGYQNGKLQEELGPEPAREMLRACGASPEETERICWLIVHHHTYREIEGIDHQILIEADLLVNLYEDGVDRAVAQTVYEKSFRTETGKTICRRMFLSERFAAVE